MFDFGFRPARGEPSAALSAAIAGATTALSVAYLNLSSFRQSEWAQDVRAKCDELLAEMHGIQEELLQRLRGLREKAGEATNSQFDLFAPRLSIVAGTDVSVAHDKVRPNKSRSRKIA
jgi:hypothetical protein